MEERNIRVNGQSTMSFSPDAIIINMTLTTVNEQYNEAIIEASEALDQIRLCLKSANFNKEDIKTTDFQVNTKYENIRKEDGTYKRIFLGYEVMNKLKIELPSDPIYLAKVLNVVSKCEAKPEFSINYEIKNKNPLEEKLLEAAIKDAEAKAEVMAKMARVKLGKVLKIEGGYISIGNINNPGLFLKVSEASLDLQPESVQGNANVMVMWKIEG